MGNRLEWPSHAPDVLSEHLDAIDQERTRRMVGSQRDKAGHFTAGLASQHLSVAKLLWGLHRDQSGFLEHLRCFAELELSLVHRLIHGEQSVQGFVTATSVRWVYAMIAGRRYDSAMSYLSDVARFESQPNFRSDATEFENLWWDATSAVLLKRSQCAQAIRKFREWLITKRELHTVPFADALSALHENMADGCDALLARMGVGHSVLYANNSDDWLDARLCLEGIALANMMVKKSWTVTQDSALIPITLVDLV